VVDLAVEARLAVERRWHRSRHLDAVIHVVPAALHRKRRMGEHQRHQQAPWLGKALRQPIDRGAYGRGVELEQVAVDGTAVERVVPLRTRLERRVMPAGEILERGRHREAETIARRARDTRTQHVAPRAGERDVIPSLSQPREDVRLVRREQVLERSMPRHVRVQAREHRDAALCAHAVLRVRVREPHTPRGQRVDRGRAYDRVAERTDAVRAELIGHEQQQVRSAGHEISMPHHDPRGSGRIRRCVQSTGRDDRAAPARRRP
jgi:hypothetical protein